MNVHQFNFSIREDVRSSKHFFTTSLYFSYSVFVCAFFFFFFNCNNFASVLYFFLMLDKLALSIEMILSFPWAPESSLFTMLGKG